MTVPRSMASCPTSSPRAWASAVDSGIERVRDGVGVLGGHRWPFPKGGDGCGEEKVNGVPARHYTGKLNHKPLLLRMVKKRREKVEEPMVKIGDRLPATADVWVTKDGLITRILLVCDLGSMKVRLQGVGRAAGQHVDPLMGLGIDDHGGIAVTPAQGEVVDADHAGHPPGGQRDAQQGAQGSVTRQAHGEYRQQTCPRPAR
jgi:hypothetical protein